LPIIDGSLRWPPDSQVALMKALRFVLLGLALAIIAGLGWRLSHPELLEGPPAQTVVVSQPVPVKRPDAVESRSIILSRLGDAPSYTPFFDRLRAEFPSDYTALIDQATAALMKGGHTPNPERLMAEALRNLRQTRGVLAAQADAQPLTEIFAAQSAMLDSLASTDPGLCADFLYGGTSPTFMAFSARHRELLERIAMATLNAIASGKEKHIDHEQPTMADFDNLEQALKAKNLSDDEIAALLDGKTFDPPLPENRLCEAGRLYLHVLNDMPEDLRLRIYALSAQLLART
jgi:hypothetical protein